MRRTLVALLLPLLCATVAHALESSQLAHELEHDAETQKLIDELKAHPAGTKTINGKIVSADEFHKHAVKHVGHDYHESLAHIHTTTLTGDALKEHVLAQDPDGDLFDHDLEDTLNPAVVRRQLRDQGVREENLERLTNEIVQAHKQERTSLHRTYAGSESKPHDRMEGFKPLVSIDVTRAEFRKIDQDKDGRVFIKEVEDHFTKKLAELKHEDIHTMLHDSHYTQDTSPENVKLVHDNLKNHYEEQLLGLESVWSGSDLNDDGYISFPEYDKFVQEAHWLAHQEHVARKVLGDDMHLFDESWRDEL